MAVKMKYGDSGKAADEDNLYASGVIDDDDTVELMLEPGGIYELYTKEWNASSGAFRGHREVLISAPEEEVYGTVAAAHNSVSTSTNSGVTITYNTDSTVTLARSATTYAVRYAVKKVI